MVSFQLTGPNGLGEGDYFAVDAYYALTGQKSYTEIHQAGNPYSGYLYVSPTPIVRGQYYDMQVEASLQNNANGFLEIWINGSEVVNYHGPLGYGGGNYWKEGVYLGWSSNQTITADYANTVVTDTPGAPLILGSVVNGNEVMLNGTAEANSTVTVYDGATKLGTVVASGSGAWFYETGTLATGSHSLTATATDTAGNVSPASSAASANITAFTGPIITQVTTSAGSGETVVGNTITFTVTMGSAVTVTGTPTLSLNDGGTATYKSGSGTNTLTFSYTVGAGDSTLTGLAITQANLPSGATIKDGSGNAAILTGAAVQFPSVVIDTEVVKTPVFGAPVVNSNGTFTYTGTAGPNTTVYFETGSTGGYGSTTVNSSGNWTFTTPTVPPNEFVTFQAYDVNSLGDVSAIGVGGGNGQSGNLPASPTIAGNALVGNAVTLYGMVQSGLSISQVTVYDGTTKLGTASINSDNSWSFTTSALPNGVHVFSATATNTHGTSAGSAPDAITVGTLGPTISSVVELPSSGDLAVGQTVTLTLNMSGATTVNTSGGTPTLTLNDGGIATYSGGSGTNALTFGYTVGAGQNTASLAATAVNLNGATISDSSGDAANLSLTGLTQTGPEIGTPMPLISAIAELPASGDLNAGNTVTFTLTMSEVVNVNTTGGTPTLALNDNGGTATYVGGSGTNTLTFNYTVGAGQSATALAATAVNLNGATIADGAGHAANLSLSGLTQTGPQISLVANGSFETNSFSGWTLGGNDGGSQIILDSNAEQGSYAAEMGPVGSNGSISQTIATTPGAQYQLTFWLANDPTGAKATPNDFTASWNGTTLLSLTNAPQQGYTEYTYDVTATGSSTTLEFAARQDPAWWNLDNIAVSEVTAPGPTVSSVAESPASGDLDAGKTVTFTLNMSEAVTVNTPAARRR